MADSPLLSLRDAVARFPSEFGLRPFPGRTFKISLANSYAIDANTVLLYIEGLRPGETLTVEPTPEGLASIIVPISK